MKHALKWSLAVGGGLTMILASPSQAQFSCCDQIIPPSGVPDLAVVRSGGIDPLVGLSHHLTYDPNQPQHWLHFTFGFATGERPDDGSIVDALTISLVDLSVSRVALLLTMDAHGVSWAPPTEGTISWPRETILHETVAFPQFQPVLDDRVAYEIRALLPGQFKSGTVRFEFQLFDYPNGQNSFAWSTTPSITSVPEPLSAGLTGLLLLLLTFIRSKNE